VVECVISVCVCVCVCVNVLLVCVCVCVCVCVHTLSKQTSSSDGQPEGNTLSALCIYSPSLQYGNLYTRTSRHSRSHTHAHTLTHIILQTPTQRYAPP